MGPILNALFVSKSKMLKRLYKIACIIKLSLRKLQVTDDRKVTHGF